jgi:hypothetical protein
MSFIRDDANSTGIQTKTKGTFFLARIASVFWVLIQETGVIPTLNPNKFGVTPIVAHLRQLL